MAASTDLPLTPKSLPAWSRALPLFDGGNFRDGAVPNVAGSRRGGAVPSTLRPCAEQPSLENDTMSFSNDRPRARGVAVISRIQF